MSRNPDCGIRNDRFKVFASWLALVVLVLSACGVDADDVDRWQREQDYDKLTALLADEHQNVDLRAQAALALVRTEPFRGRHIGIDLMLATLAQTPAESLQAIVAKVAAVVVTELKKPPPPEVDKGQHPPDETVKYKDVAHFLLSTPGVSGGDEAVAKQLREALADWAMADLDRRIADRSQYYSLERTFRLLGPTALIGIADKIKGDSRHLKQLAKIVAAVGSLKTKNRVAEKLVAIAKYVQSEKWRDDHKNELIEANRRAKIEPTPGQFTKQLSAYQRDRLRRVFAALAQVRGKVVQQHCQAMASKEDEPEWFRRFACACWREMASSQQAQKEHEQVCSELLPRRPMTRAEEIASELAELDVATVGPFGSLALADDEKPKSLADIGATAGDKAKSEKKIKGKAKVGGAVVSGGEIKNAKAVVARMRGRFRRCYVMGRKQNPDMAGTATLTAKVGPQGEVLGVGGGASPPLAPIMGCLKAVVAGAQFAAPTGGGAVVTIPITFVKQP